MPMVYHHALVCIFIIFICVAYGQSQTLASVGFSILYHFRLSRMVDHKLSLVWVFHFLSFLFCVAWSITDSR